MKPDVVAADGFGKSASGSLEAIGGGEAPSWDPVAERVLMKGIRINAKGKRQPVQD
ncbi:MAG: hypothetical protein LBR80_12615 [Deltaproteobacteria bacterium]|nr:hypothetical protein [Deltaproteobacteria bacterium]